MAGAYGGVDVLVNNAGVVKERPFLEVTDEEWDEVLGTNVRGAMLCTRAVGRRMVAAGSGRVVNVASSFAVRGIPGYAAYAASKGAIVSLTRTLAMEWARHGVRVNAVAPGPFETEWNAAMFADPEVGPRIRRTIPLGRVGQPDELGPLVCYLASPASGFVTGETIVVDGGARWR